MSKVYLEITTVRKIWNTWNYLYIYNMIYLYIHTYQIIWYATVCLDIKAYHGPDDFWNTWNYLGLRYTYVDPINYVDTLRNLEWRYTKRLI